MREIPANNSKLLLKTFAEIEAKDFSLDTAYSKLADSELQVESVDAGLWQIITEDLRKVYQNQGLDADEQAKMFKELTPIQTELTAGEVKILEKIYEDKALEEQKKISLEETKAAGGGDQDAIGSKVLAVGNDHLPDFKELLE